MAFFEVSLVTRGALAEGAYSLLLELMEAKGWSPAELAQRIGWTERRVGKETLEGWLKDPEKRPEDCCTVVLEALAAGRGSELGESSPTELPSDHMGKLYKSYPPRSYPMSPLPDDEVRELSGDPAAGLSESRLRLYELALGGLLDLVTRNPDLAAVAIERHRIHGQLLYEVTDKDPD